MGTLSLTAGAGQPSLVSEVAAALLNRGDLSIPRIISSLNFAQDEISRLHDFKEMKGFQVYNTLFTGNPLVDKKFDLLPSVKHIHTAVLLNGTMSRKLVEKPWRMFDLMFPAPEALGRSIPYYYSRWNSTIILNPVPDRQYPIQMRVTLLPAIFKVNVVRTSDYESKDDLLIKLAAAYLWRSYGRSDKGLEFEMEVFGPDPGRIGGMFAAAVKQDSDMPDMEINSSPGDISTTGDYWANPFIRSSP